MQVELTKKAARQLDQINEPYYSLSIVEPILAHFADEPLVIETNLTAEEKADIEEGRKLRQEHPEEFISLDNRMKKTRETEIDDLQNILEKIKGKTP